MFIWIAVLTPSKRKGPLFLPYEKNEKGLRKSPDAIVGADAHGGPRGSGQIYAGIPGKKRTNAANLPGICAIIEISLPGRRGRRPLRSAPI
jgi:hypothetical protein